MREPGRETKREGSKQREGREKSGRREGAHFARLICYVRRDYELWITRGGEGVWASVFYFTFKGKSFSNILPLCTRYFCTKVNILYKSNIFTQKCNIFEQI